MKKISACLALIALLMSAAYAGSNEDLREAVKKGDVKKAEKLLNGGADTNTRYTEKEAPMCGGETPLIMASNLGYTKMVELLLSKGADPNVTNEGFSALQYAVQGHIEIVRMLVEKGAEINKADPNGYYPIHHAASHGSIEIVKYLLSKGAIANVKGFNGETPAECTKDSKIKKLLESQLSK